MSVVFTSSSKKHLLRFSSKLFSENDSYRLLIRMVLIGFELDDSELLAINPSECDIQLNIIIFISWAQYNNLQVHHDKTKLIVSSGSPPELFLKEETFSSVDDVKDIETYVDKNLNWTSHIDCKFSSPWKIVCDF